MRKVLLSAALLATFAIPALAEEASPVTGSFTIASDYRFRGLSQTYKLPAVQGGIDYANPSGIYLGTWMSNVSGNQYLNGAGLEWDVYGGYRKSFGDWGLDVGGLYYYYPGAHQSDAGKTKYNNFELYAGVSYKWLSFKYSHAVTNLFGIKTETYGNVCENANFGDAGNCLGTGDSKGSGYFDLSANIPLVDKLTLNAHVGHQKVKSYGDLSYTDYKLGVTYDLQGWMLGAAVIGTNAKKGFYYACKVSDGASCKKIGEPTVVVTVGKTF